MGPSALRANGYRLMAFGDSDVVGVVAYFWMNGTSGGAGPMAEALTTLRSMGRQNDPDDESERLELIGLLEQQLEAEDVDGKSS